MNITVTPPGTTSMQDQWFVWAALTDGDPHLCNESFIIGTGTTRPEACRNAIRACQEAILAVIDEFSVPQPVDSTAKASTTSR